MKEIAEAYPGDKVTSAAVTVRRVGLVMQFWNV